MKHTTRETPRVVGETLSTIQHHHCAVNVIWTGPRLVDELLDTTCPREELGKSASKHPAAGSASVHGPGTPEG
jgi:hypothetical protein